MTKKDKAFLDKNYLVSIMLLHLLYSILFLGLSLLFWGAGHGSAVPFVVFFSPFLISFFNGNEYQVSVLFISQMPFYCVIWWVFYRGNFHIKYLAILPVLHFVAAVIAVFFSGVNLSDRYYYWFFFTLMIMYPYWSRYFFLLLEATGKLSQKSA